MLDVAWTEIIVILTVAGIFLNSEDIPMIAKSIVSFFRKLAEMREDVSTMINNIAQEVPLTEIKDEINKDIFLTNQKVSFIVDLDGNLREAYNVSDIKRNIETKDFKSTSNDDNKTIH